MTNNTMLNNTWEIISIINHYNEKMVGRNFFSKEAEEYKKLYAQALRLQCKEPYGYVMTVQDFIQVVDQGDFVDYDGSGVFIDWEGNRQESVRCNAQWLEVNQKDYPFVLWFNK